MKVEKFVDIAKGIQRGNEGALSSLTTTKVKDKLKNNKTRFTMKRNTI